MSDTRWLPWGAVTICPTGWPDFTTAVPKVPRLYRFTLSDSRQYIGEAGNLWRRLREYRRPTKGNVGEHVIHEALKASRGATLELLTD